MKYRGSRTQVECKKCSTPIPVPISTNQSNDQATPITQSSGVATHASVQIASPAIPSQQDVQESFEPTGIPIAAELLLGILLGVVAFVLISYFKADISRFGLVLIVSGALLALSIQYYVLHVIVRRPVTPHATRRILGVPLAMFLCISGFLTVFEVCIPNRDGICRKMIEGERPMTDDEIKVAQSNEAARRVLEQAAADAKKHELLTKNYVEKESQWNQADCLLINPGHKVIGVRVKNPRGEPEFTVVAKSDDTVQGKLSAESIMKEFWDRRIPIVAHDPQLARRVFADVDESRPLSSEYHDKMRRVWAPIRFIPNKKPVSYIEAKGGTKRFGFNLGSQERGFWFCDIVPKRQYGIYASPGVEDHEGILADLIENDIHVQQGSKPQELLDHELRREADLLDFFVMDMLRKLQGHQNQAVSLYDMRAPSIYVDDVEYDASYADVSVSELRAGLSNLNAGLREEVEKAINQYKGLGMGLDAVVDDLRKLTVGKQSEEYRRGLREVQRQQLDADIAVLRHRIKLLESFLELKKSITGEIRTRLIRTQMTLVERSPQFLKLSSREAMYRKQNTSSVQLAGLPFSDAMQAGMLDATHILLAQVRRPKDQGSYELSMRLVDARTGVILWEEQGDRRDMGLIQSQSMSMMSERKSKVLAGNWRDHTLGNEFEVTDDGENVRIKLTRSSHVREFELGAHYVNGTLKADSCFIVFNTGSGKRHPIEASIKMLSDSKCEIRHQTIQVNNYGAVYRGSYETVVLERSK